MDDRSSQMLGLVIICSIVAGVWFAIGIGVGWWIA